MIPFRDDIPSRTYPYITVGLITLNVIAFTFTLYVGIEPVTTLFGAIPLALTSHLTPQPISPLATVFTSMFLHAGFLHVGGNMLYLWIFGDNVEDRMGHMRFLAFYLTGGIVAAYAHAFSDASSTLPMVGASGAISAVLGAYIYLYPRARIDTLLFLGFFFQIIRLPALIVIGFWAIIQIISGLLSNAAGEGNMGGVAWFAHIGGFIYGLIAVRIFVPGRRRTA